MNHRGREWVLGFWVAMMGVSLQAENLLVGAARADITGPAAEQTMAGHGKIFQDTRGIHTRLYARAFWFEEEVSARTFAVVVTDLAMVSDLVRAEVLKLARPNGLLQLRDENFLLLATNTHSGPGGYMPYTLYNLKTLGVSKENVQVIVEGIVQALRLARNHRKPSQIRLNQGPLLETKSTSLMTLLKMVESETEIPIGALNWFSTPPSSLSHDNHLISSDHKGIAAYSMEKAFHGKNPRFVSGFANETEWGGDPHFLTEQMAGKLDIEQNRIVARAQQEKAQELFVSPLGALLAPRLDSRSAWVRMPGLEVESAFTGKDHPIRLCQAAVGKSFFQWASFPLWGPWTAEKLPFQLHRIGSLAIIGAPAQISPLAGDLLRQQVGDILRPVGVEVVVVSGLANSYSEHVTTFEEYQMQGYEGRHTLFGPYTFAAYLQIFTQLALSMAGNGPSVKTEVAPVWKVERFSNFRPGVWMDRAGQGYQFGDVLQQPSPTYHRGETVEVVFVSGHPKNDYRTDGSFLVVERYQNQKWIPVFVDADDETRYEWKRREGKWCWGACSKAILSWEIGQDTPSGDYRMVHRGNQMPPLRRAPRPFVGYSEIFHVE